MLKYGIENKVTGVYVIICLANNMSYVGASVNVSARLSNHFGRDSRNYSHRKFYQDILKYGIEGFTWSLVERCSEEKLLEQEQFWYDMIQPEYNDIRPCKVPFLNESVRESSVKGMERKGTHRIKKELYRTDEYVELFRSVHVDKMRPITMTDSEGKIVNQFKSISETARWLDDNTSFKAKNKASKVKAVADGERRTAFGYKYYYTNEHVETIQ